MEIQALNEALEWRGIKFIIEGSLDADELIPVQVRFNYPESVKGEKWMQLQAALSHQFEEVFHVLIIGETETDLIGLFFTRDWLDDRSEKWIALERYLTFMLFPHEEETRPTDALAKSYPVIQKEEILVEGAREASEKVFHLRELEKSLLFNQFVLTPEQSKHVMENLFETEAIDVMMNYCIKTLPQYSGSQLETIGEELWKEWQAITEKIPM